MNRQLLVGALAFVSHNYRHHHFTRTWTALWPPLASEGVSAREEALEQGRLRVIVANRGAAVLIISSLTTRANTSLIALRMATGRKRAVGCRPLQSSARDHPPAHGCLLRAPPRLRRSWTLNPHCRPSRPMTVSCTAEAHSRNKGGGHRRGLPAAGCGLRQESVKAPRIWHRLSHLKKAKDDLGPRANPPPRLLPRDLTSRPLPAVRLTDSTSPATRRRHGS